MKCCFTYIASLMLAVSLHAQVTGKDIIISNLSTASTKVPSGARIAVTYRVSNIGTRTITESYAERIYLSKDTLLDSKDTLLGTTPDRTLDLTTGTSANYYSASVSVTVPNLISGAYYLMVWGDAKGTVPENNETNNGKAILRTIILTVPTEEANTPTLISPGLVATSLRAGLNYFKFEVEPGYHYAFIMNSGPKHFHTTTLKSRGAPAVTIFFTHTGDKFQARVGGGTLSTYNITNNYSHAKSALMFYADSGYYPGPYYNYVHVELSGNTTPDQGSVYIKLLKLSRRSFKAPFAGAAYYHNTFGHREILAGRTSPTANGHLGIDVVPKTDAFVTDLTRPVVPIADGKLIKKQDLRNGQGWGIWVYHESLGYTSIYAHLNEPSIAVGTQVYAGLTKLGTLLSSQGHLHLEVVPGQYTLWNAGYAAGTPQVDPLTIIFEK